MMSNLFNKIVSKKSGARIALAIVAISIFTVSVGREVYFTKVSVAPKKDSVASVKAFMQVYEVLVHPRCMNCHPAGDIPLQGEDSHLHAMLPKRGIDGKGVYAMKCNNCHQPTNSPGLHTPPGNPNWHLPAADMKMVFQGKSPAELAKQLLDPATNSHKTHEQLIEHVSFDKLVIGGWSPGEGRELPPGTHKEFVAKFKTWIETGAYVPSAGAKAPIKKNK
jgi:hypothetical protein